MSLIKCPECNHEVSSKAPSCPNCGVAIVGNVKRCPVCNSFVLMDAEECPKCQTKFAVEKNEPVQPVTTEPVKQEMQEKQATPTPPPPVVENEKKANGKSSAPWYLLLVATLVILIGGFLYWDNKNQEASEERAFTMLDGCTNSLNYDDFIARYPKSRHLDEVKARLHALEQVDSMWKTLCLHPEAEALRRFLDENPSTPHRPEALHKLDSLDWYAADRQGTVAAYEAYIVRHDNGEYINQAYTAREGARLRARQDSIAADSAAVAVPSTTH